MFYYSTSDKEKKKGITFLQASLSGLASDGGLFMPKNIPKLPSYFFDNIENYSNEEIAFVVAEAFIANEIPESILKQIVAETINFPFPLKELGYKKYALELFHGPTFAFKDVGARFMAGVLTYAIQKENKKLNIIVATSGDTGSAVASAFHRIPNIEVNILYPKGKVSEMQQMQLTTWGDNIHAIELEGNFDDCQKIAKQLLNDKDCSDNQLLSSANSINIARLLPQAFYYFIAYKELKKFNLPLVFSVPSGNFGNLTSGIIAKMMGLPIERFIASTNINNAVPLYLKNSTYEIKPSIQTISNAMDVCNPSNFERLSYIFNHDVRLFRKEMDSYFFTDKETEQAMIKVRSTFNYNLDPHGAVAYLGLNKYSLDAHSPFIGVFLETAHPAKFKQIVEKTIGKKIEIPEKLFEFTKKKVQVISCGNNYEQAKSIIQSKHLKHNII